MKKKWNPGDLMLCKKSLRNRKIPPYTEGNVSLVLFVEMDIGRNTYYFKTLCNNTINTFFFDRKKMKYFFEKVS